MPPNHIACLGMSTAHAIVCGGATVFIDRFEPARMLDALEREKITFFLHAPAIHQAILDEPDFAQRDLSRLEYWLWGGAPAPLGLVKRLQQHGVRIGTAFGMTELGSYVSFSQDGDSNEALSQTIGRPDKHFELRLANAQGEQVALGEDGEIQARGNWLLNGYFNQPEETAAAYTDDGWFRTGDVARQDSDGNWFLVGRTQGNVQIGRL